MKRSTVDWRIHKLTEMGVLHRRFRGVYSISKKEVEEYIPEIDSSLKLLSGIVQKKFPYVDICVWSTQWLSEFMLHQPNKFYTILEVENEAMDAVFYELSSRRKNVFLNPTQEIMNRYVNNAPEPIIINRLVTESPIVEVGKVRMATLEKILVDIYSDPIVYHSFQGAEMNRIYQNALKKYHINKVGMLRYANRRAKKEKVETLIGGLEK